MHKAFFVQLIRVLRGCLSSAQVERDEMKERMLTRTVDYPDNFSEHAKSLCEGLLAREVDKRMGFKNDCCDEIRAHPFFKDINWRKLNGGIIFCLHVRKITQMFVVILNQISFFQVFCLLLLFLTPKWCMLKVWMTSGLSPRSRG